VARVYEAMVQGILDAAAFERLGKGIRLEDGWARADVRPLRRMERNSYIRVTMREGRRHLVRRLLSAAGHEVIDLKRVSFGPLELGGLPPGQWRPLDPSEVKRLKGWVSDNARSAAGKGGAKVSPGKKRFKNINLRQRVPGRR
jgi:23S rRNA pseudouridine2605 synthase